MTELFSEVSLFSLVLTVAAFQVGLWGQKKTNSPICNPILVGAVLVVGVLLITGIDPQTYQAGTSLFSWLLTPATVCLAVPLYQQFKVLKKNMPAIFIGILAGTVTSLVCVFLLCKLFSLNHQITVSLLPKSITTAMGFVLSEQNGGIPALTSVVIIFTGILGNLTGAAMCKLLKLTDPISKGVAFGTASHVIATPKAAQIHPVAGAVSSLSLTIAGILTGFLFPIVCSFL